MFEDYKNLWVYIETGEGKAKSVGLELLNPGRRLADKIGGKLVAVVVGHNTDEAVKSAIKHGAEEVIVVDRPEYAQYTTEAYAHALTELQLKYKPSIFLIGATNIGRDLGPRVACRLKTGLTADCTSLDIDEESGNMAWTRPAFGGNLMATILCPNTRPQLGTVRPGVFKKAEAPAKGEVKITKEDIATPPEMIRTRLIEVIKETAGRNG